MCMSTAIDDDEGHVRILNKHNKFLQLLFTAIRISEDIKLLKKL